MCNLPELAAVDFRSKHLPLHSGLQFSSEGQGSWSFRFSLLVSSSLARSNWWGIACPAHCGPSNLWLGFALLVVGFLTGVLVTAGFLGYLYLSWGLRPQSQPTSSTARCGEAAPSKDCVGTCMPKVTIEGRGFKVVVDSEDQSPPHAPTSRASFPFKFLFGCSFHRIP